MFIETHDKMAGMEHTHGNPITMGSQMALDKLYKTLNYLVSEQFLNEEIQKTMLSG